jgi:hypothetical protein
MRILFLPATKADTDTKEAITRLIIESGHKLVSWSKDLKTDDYDMVMACTDENNDEYFCDLIDEEFNIAKICKQTETDFLTDNVEFTVGRGIYDTYIKSDKPFYLCTNAYLSPTDSPFDTQYIVMAVQIDEAAICNAANFTDYARMAPHGTLYNMPLFLNQKSHFQVIAQPGIGKSYSIQLSNNTIPRRRLIKWKRS